MLLGELLLYCDGPVITDIIGLDVSSVIGQYLKKKIIHTYLLDQCTLVALDSVVVWFCLFVVVVLFFFLVLHMSHNQCRLMDPLG